MPEDARTDGGEMERSVRIGFVGLGQMGKWMALNLVKAGFPVTVFDIDPGAVSVLVGQGAASAGSPEELARQAGWIFLSLPNTAVVESVLFGERGIVCGAGPGAVVVDLGTTSYLPTLDLARRLEEHGLRFADAPVSGMDTRAREGTLTIMFGGDEALFRQLSPALNAMGDPVIHMGAVGNGQLAKLVNNLLYNTSCAAIAEILPMAVKLGLDPEKVCRVITTGSGRSFGAEFFTPLILQGRFEVGYPLKDAYKDMVSAAEISVERKIPLPLVHAVTTTYQMALAEGYGHLGKGAMIRVFERLVGVEFRAARQEGGRP
jgi:3-hydroxyisobutyrate dehydrogenase-like beta-hydroxyacid dehydrogenase